MRSWSEKSRERSCRASYLPRTSRRETRSISSGLIGPCPARSSRRRALEASENLRGLRRSGRKAARRAGDCRRSIRELIRPWSPLKLGPQGSSVRCVGPKVLGYILVQVVGDGERECVFVKEKPLNWFLFFFLFVWFGLVFVFWFDTVRFSVGHL